MTAKTAGQQLAETLRRLHTIGTRTRRYRKGDDLHAAVLETIRLATAYPGYYTGETNSALSAAWGVYCAWDKHVSGARVNPALWGQIQQLSPYRLIALVGQMVDAGVSNNGEGETFFRQLKIS
jgi:hypothetical protein